MELMAKHEYSLGDIREYFSLESEAQFPFSCKLAINTIHSEYHPVEKWTKKI